MFCKKCGHSLPENTKFCSLCGTEQMGSLPVSLSKTLSQPVKTEYCPRCGEVLKLGGKFCGKCGAKLRITTEFTSLNGSSQMKPSSTRLHSDASQLKSGSSSSIDTSAVSTRYVSPAGRANRLSIVLPCLLCLSLGVSGGFLLWQQLNGTEALAEAGNSTVPDIVLPAPEPQQSTPSPTAEVPKSFVPETTSSSETVPETYNVPETASVEPTQFIVDNYRWDSDSITNELLTGMSRESVMWTRNEIYARHGYVFLTPDIQNHFEQQPWYSPNPNYSDDLLNQTERKNIDTIVLYEKAQGWRK